VSDADVREGWGGTHWTTDGRSVLVDLFPEELGREGYAALVKGKVPRSGSTDGVTAKVFEFDPSVTGSGPSTDQVNLDFLRRDLGLVDVETGALRRLVKGARVGSYALAPNHTAIAYTVLTRPEKPGTGQYLFEVIVHDLRTDTTRVVAPDVRLDLFASSFSWSPASDAVAYRTAGPLAEDDIYVVAREGRPARLVAHNPKVDPLGLEEFNRSGMRAGVCSSLARVSCGAPPRTAQERGLRVASRPRTPIIAPHQQAVLPDHGARAS
jgi:hypothetical protein